LVARGLLVEKTLVMGSLLAFVGGTLVKEALSGMLVKKVLAMSSLLFFVSGTCWEGVGGPLPVGDGTHHPTVC
jgi:hypothetical protein